MAELFADQPNGMDRLGYLGGWTNPRRFRFSIATHMAEEGASVFHIAEVLDHSDTQNVRVYVETVSSIADPVAKAINSADRP